MKSLAAVELAFETGGGVRTSSLMSAQAVLRFCLGGVVTSMKVSSLAPELPPSPRCL